MGCPRCREEHSIKYRFTFPTKFSGEGVQQQEFPDTESYTFLECGRCYMRYAVADGGFSKKAYEERKEMIAILSKCNRREAP